MLPRSMDPCAAPTQQVGGGWFQEKSTPGNPTEPYAPVPMSMKRATTSQSSAVRKTAVLGHLQEHGSIGWQPQPAWKHKGEETLGAGLNRHLPGLAVSAAQAAGPLVPCPRLPSTTHVSFHTASRTAGTSTIMTLKRTAGGRGWWGWDSVTGAGWQKVPVLWRVARGELRRGRAPHSRGLGGTQGRGLGRQGCGMRHGAQARSPMKGMKRHFSCRQWHEAASRAGW